MNARERYLDVLSKHWPNRKTAGSERYWAPELETAPRSVLQAVQLEKFSAAFDYLFECSPYYRARFLAAGLTPGSIRSFEDVARVPVTRKSDWMPDFQLNPPWGTFSPLTTQKDVDLWMVFSTSGTTTQPRLFRSTAHDREMLGWLCARALYAYGVRRGDVAMNCFFHGPSVAAWGLNEGLAKLGCAVIPGGPMLSERRAHFVKRLRPRVLLGTPSALLTLGHRLWELGERPDQMGVQILVCAGEAGAAVPATKARLEKLWNATAMDDFGCTEVAQAPLGYSCKEAANSGELPVHVHLMEDTHLIEVLDPATGSPVKPGERGTLVVSNLYSESGPYLRFDMGDWVALSPDACGCGRTHSLVRGGLLGRSDHCVKIKGLQFFPGTFEDALRSTPGIGDEYRVEVNRSEWDPTGSDAVKIVADVLPGFTPNVNEMARRLRGLLGISVELELLPPGSLPRTEGKGARFLDLRKGSTP